jgi:hypothetical protein
MLEPKPIILKDRSVTLEFMIEIFAMRRFMSTWLGDLLFHCILLNMILHSIISADNVT